MYRTNLDGDDLQRWRDRCVHDQELACEIFGRVDAPQACLAEPLGLGKPVMVVQRVGRMDRKRLHPKTLVRALDEIARTILGGGGEWEGTKIQALQLCKRWDQVANSQGTAELAPCSGILQMRR